MTLTLAPARTDFKRARPGVGETWTSPSKMGLVGRAHRLVAADFSGREALDAGRERRGMRRRRDESRLSPRRPELVAILLVFGLASAGCWRARAQPPVPGVAETSDPEEALLDAVGVGDAAAAEKELEAGGDANQRTPEGFTLLMIAAEDAHRPIVESLLAHGADPNATTEKGVTALILAAAKGNAAIVQRLLARGADPRAVTGAGTTALMAAAAEGHPQTLRILLRHRPDIDGRDREGKTALMFAAANGHGSVVRALLEAGARADVRDVSGESALTLAEKARHLETAALLRAGADAASNSEWSAPAQ
jgi:ankyrin repeat protein